ncbi:PAS domain S-box protein [Halothiobacillus diazotrophicus]|nr:PAS domain S-box protein [Halothiobacillus diazotrophicus]
MAALQELSILDTPPEAIYDHLIELLCDVFDAPIGVFALTEAERHWFKAVRGLDFTSLARNQSLCPMDPTATQATSTSVCVIADCTDDPRNREKMLVRDEHVRFYAGAPLLVDDTVAVGTLCLMDRKPRTWSSDDQARFERFAALARDLLQRRLDRQRLAHRESEHVRNGLELNTILQTAAIGIVRIDPRGTIEAVNPSVTAMFGYQPEEILGQNVSLLMPEPWRSAHDGYIARYLSTQDPKVIGAGRKVSGLHRDGRTFPLQLAVSEIRSESQVHFVGFLTDLSALAHVESELDSERALLRSIIDSITTPMSTVDLDGRLMLVNKAFASCAGASPEAMLGRPVADYLPAEDAAFNAESNRRVVETGRSLSFHAPTTMHGEPHIFETTKSPLRDAQGAIAGVVTVSQDMTELNQLTEQLKQGEHLRSLGERFAHLGFWSLRFGEETMAVSPGFVQLIGLPEGTQQLPHRALRERIDPIYHAAIDQEIAAATQEHRPFRFDYALIDSVAAGRWLRARGNIERDANGRPVRLIGITQDVTEEVNARHRSEQQRQLLDGLNNAVQSFMASVARADVWQQMLDHLLMLTKADFGFLGEVIHGEDQSRCLKIHAITNLSWSAESDALYERVLAGDMMFCNENNLIGAVMKTGSVVVTHDVMNDPRRGGLPPGHPELRNYLAIPLYQGTELVGVVAIANRAEGVSEALAEFLAPFTSTYAIMIANFRQHLEQQAFRAALIASKEQAEQANRGKSEFLSSMSHELRTPLNAILGFAQLMAASRKEPLSEKQQGFINHILKAGQHLLHLVNDVLNLAKIEAGELSLSLEPIALDQLVSDPLLMIADMAKEADITLHNHVAEQKTLSETDIVCVDLTRARQVLMNLISNAIKYNRPGGSVTLRALPLQLKDDRRPMLGLAIEDTGIGIPQSKQHRLFRPFERLGQETSSIEGTGIGLMITKQIVEQMGGLIEVDSEEGVGSTFSIFLPAMVPGHATGCHGDASAETPEEDLVPASVPAAPQSPFLLLYVEDNPANAALMRDIIDDREDTELRLASTGEQGLELALSLQPDLILMDINLPGISGQQAAARLKKWSDTSHIPIVALSADATAPIMRAAEDSGLFAQYLTKPLNLVELNTLLDQHIARKQRGTSSS